MRTTAIVVGTDGTASKAAVQWAVREAQRRHLPLQIVHAYDWIQQESRVDICSEDIDVARELARAVTSEARGQALETAPDVDVRADLVIGPATERLLEIAELADLMVLGSRGRGGLAGLLLGSVSRRVATHAPCSVVVVRDGDATSDGPVVAGVDDSPAADDVLKTAFEAAADRSVGLIVVRSHLPVIPLWPSTVMADGDTRGPEVAEQARLDERLEPWRVKYPDVPVGTVLTRDGAADALVAASRTAQLVVVGSRRRGGVAGALRGSVGLHLLHHAHCPVYLARQS
ncbi:universal stress protein [Actinoplanes sp. NPDC049118]|uniref:universal stress protein n=1 Tax=Actinoplanes sp. NPDC049118 TaxID=3155769 RepID=UPI0033F2FCC0